MLEIFNNMEPSNRIIPALMKKLISIIALLIWATSASAQGSFSSATMELEVTVISGSSVENVQPLELIVRNDRVHKQKDGSFAIRAVRGVDFEVRMTASTELRNEFGESLIVPLESRRVFDQEDKLNNIYIRPVDPGISRKLRRGSYEGTVNTQIYYM